MREPNTMHHELNDNSSTPTSAPVRAGRALTIVLFTLYAAALVGLVLFKFPFRFQPAGAGRVLNLIPLAGSFSGGVLQFGEIIDNVLIFVPLGLYLCMLKYDWLLLRKILSIVAVSVAFELIQYAFAIGRSDITDILANTLGGLIGIGLYKTANKVFKERTNEIVHTAAIFITIGAALLVAFLLLRTMHGR